MPLFLIEKDSSTKLPKDCSEEEAEAFLAQGFGVQRIGENGELLPFAAEVAEETEGAEEPTSEDAPAEVEAEQSPAQDQAPAPAPARKAAAARKTSTKGK